MKENITNQIFKYQSRLDQAVQTNESTIEQFVNKIALFINIQKWYKDVENYTILEKSLKMLFTKFKMQGGKLSFELTKLGSVLYKINGGCSVVDQKVQIYELFYKLRMAA